MLIFTEGETYSPRGSVSQLERAVNVYHFGEFYIVEQIEWMPERTEERWSSDAGRHVPTTFPQKSLLALEAFYQSDVIRAAIGWMDTGEWNFVSR